MPSSLQQVCCSWVELPCNAEQNQLLAQSFVAHFSNAHAIASFQLHTRKHKSVQFLDELESERMGAGGDLPQKSREELRGSLGSAASASNGASTSTNGAQKPAAQRAASPFGSKAGASSPFGDLEALTEPKGMSPTMEADPEPDLPWWRSIKPSQIFLAFTFSLMTLSMLATVWVVNKTGAIHFNVD